MRLNAPATSPHSSLENCSMCRVKSPRPTASALSRRARSGWVIRRINIQTLPALNRMPTKLITPNMT